jgi:hypothetical protein
MQMVRLIFAFIVAHALWDAARLMLARWWTRRILGRVVRAVAARPAILAAVIQAWRAMGFIGRDAARDGEARDDHDGQDHEDETSDDGAPACAE